VRWAARRRPWASHAPEAPGRLHPCRAGCCTLTGGLRTHGIRATCRLDPHGSTRRTCARGDRLGLGQRLLPGSARRAGRAEGAPRALRLHLGAVSPHTARARARAAQPGARARLQRRPRRRRAARLRGCRRPGGRRLGCRGAEAGRSPVSRKMPGSCAGKQAGKHPGQLRLPGSACHRLRASAECQLHGCCGQQPYGAHPAAGAGSGRAGGGGERARVRKGARQPHRRGTHAGWRRVRVGAARGAAHGGGGPARAARRGYAPYPVGSCRVPFGTPVASTPPATSTPSDSRG